MGKMAIDRSQSAPVDVFLRDEMARSNRALRTLAPVISHMLQCDGPSLVSDEIVARLRGMLGAIADELLTSFPSEQIDPASDPKIRVDLIESLSTHEPLVDHLYAMALEGVLTQQLSQRAGIDPVLSPMLQELIASDRPEVASLAMRTLAAQSRFAQGQSRMEITLGELPVNLIANVVSRIEEIGNGLGLSHVAETSMRIKQSIDESESRIALFARLVTSMQGGAIAALDLNHAGLALFTSAAASLTGTHREDAVYSCHEGQRVRLALTLKAAGLGNTSIKQQLALLGAATSLPADFDAMAQSYAIDALRELSGG